MDGPDLSWRERRILRQIELGLGQDADLELRLRTMRLGRLDGLRRALRRVPLCALLLVAVCAVGLATAGVPAAAVAVRVVCGAAAAVAVLALVRSTRRARRGR
ncbi:DUF3040 domain-containing protein [Kitasatospora sp. DSM 101779]|uniref:DUF3040 domain-containing protein n=1 Tax=Kitasatospora sp. DSM 101779 TaxID=2853165 RepID=UPI0021D9883E|nr:DUF3040 domain-containing protein [Kitasatospora sp. DSM 101779]MCU7821261.1 DUF3040 domain-containing protein [Kitasatospora sp. DSM 101779]